MSAVLWTIGAFAVCIVFLYLAYRMEPHWVAKDGQRFLTTSEPMDRFGTVTGRRREVRGAFLADDEILLSHRAFLRSTKGVWRVQAKSPAPPSGREVYVLHPVPPDPDGSMILLRVPAKSSLVPALDARTPPPAGQRSDT